MDSIVIYLAFISCSVIFTEKQIYKVFITTCKLVSVILKCSFDKINLGLGKDFSLKLTILLHELHIEILTVMEYNLYA